MPSDNAIATSTQTTDEQGFYSDELLLNDFESAFSATMEEISDLKDDYEKIGDPDYLVEVVKNEIWEQFKNQIGLDATSESLIQKYKNEHPEGYTKEIGDAVMQDPAYRKANADMKAAQEQGNLVDAYTGKNLDSNTKANLDHVISRKELSEDLVFMMSGESLADVANTKENLAATNESLNKSKGAKSIPDYIKHREQREADLRKKNQADHEKIDKMSISEEEKRRRHEKVDKRLKDKLDANDQRMMERHAAAKKATRKKTLFGATKQTLKKAGRDALKAMAIGALFDLLKSLMNGLVRFLKDKQKSFARFMEEIKISITNFISHITSLVKTGVNTLVSTVISQILDPILHIFKKFASFIKQGFSSLRDAIKYLRDKENKNKPLGIKIAQIGKIVTAGFAASIAIVLGEIIEKVLLSIPIMVIAIPGLGTLASITGLFFSSVIGGIIGAIIINLLDRYIADRQRSENRVQQIQKKNEALWLINNIAEKRVDILSKTSFEVHERINARHNTVVNTAEQLCNDLNRDTSLYNDTDDILADTDDILAKTNARLKKLKK